MSGAALWVIPGCTPVEVAPPHTQTTAPHMLSPVEEERKSGTEGEARGEGRQMKDYRNKQLETWPRMTNRLLINMTS